MYLRIHHSGHGINLARLSCFDEPRLPVATLRSNINIEAQEVNTIDSYRVTWLLISSPCGLFVITICPPFSSFSPCWLLWSSWWSMRVHHFASFLRVLFQQLWSLKTLSPDFKGKTLRKFVHFILFQYHSISLFFYTRTYIYKIYIYIREYIYIYSLFSYHISFTYFAHSVSICFPTSMFPTRLSIRSLRRTSERRWWVGMFHRFSGVLRHVESIIVVRYIYNMYIYIHDCNYYIWWWWWSKNHQISYMVVILFIDIGMIGWRSKW